MYMGDGKNITPQIVMVVLKGGPTHSDVRVPVEFHHFVAPNDTEGGLSPQVKRWTYKKTIFDHALPIH